MSTVVKDLGAVSAYAYAVEKGYTGTEAEFAELMADYAEVGQRAEDAADSALESKTAAQTAATTATNKASEATTAAQTATTKAAEAQAYADAAALDASQALSAASTATTKATEATTAAATATSAATTATTAKDDAVSAKTAAQTAQTGAETAAASVSASAEQIATNAEDISQLKSEKADVTDLLKAFPTDTAQGAVASFADGANVPVKSLIVNIDPVQSGSGDPSPDNVRPISGHTQAVVTRCGKNLADFTDEYTVSVTGLPSSYEKRSATLTPIPIVNGKAYRFLCTGEHVCAIYSVFDTENNLVRRLTGVDSGTVLNTSDGAYMYVCGYDTSDTKTVTADENTLMVVFDTETDAAYKPYNGQTVTIALGQTVYGGKLDVVSGELVIDRAMVDMGTLTWRQDTTTRPVDGATIHAFYAESYTAKRIGNNVIPNMYSSQFIADTITHVDYGGHDTIKDNICSGADVNGRIWAYGSTYNNMTVAEFKTAMSGVMLCYEVLNPTTITLTPHEVTALLGSNNVWADSGDSTVEYRADPTLYVQRKIAEAISALS